jgi:hypothetical protein
VVDFPPLFLRARSPRPTLDVSRATRAASRSGNRPEVPPYSPARRAIVHRATRAVPRSPGFGALYIFLYLVSSRSRPCSHPPTPHRIRHCRIISYRSASPVPSRSRPCVHHPPTLSFAPPLLSAPDLVQRTRCSATPQQGLVIHNTSCRHLPQLPVVRTLAFPVFHPNYRGHINGKRQQRELK